MSATHISFSIAIVSFFYIGFKTFIGSHQKIAYILLLPSIIVIVGFFVKVTPVYQMYAKEFKSRSELVKEQIRKGGEVTVPFYDNVDYRKYRQVIRMESRGSARIDKLIIRYYKEELDRKKGAL